jgi:diguanylate cyclase (GGDEF)-like protein
MLVRRLVRSGFEVVEATGGHDALGKLASQHFDLVLTDVMIADLGGNEVLRRIRATWSDSELPVIMISGKTQSEDVVESLTLGANDYVIRPIDFSVTLARINTQLARKRAGDAERRARESLERETARLQQQIEQQREQRRQSEERLRFLAYHDSLTGLWNREAFRDLLAQALGGQQPALLFVDLDRFKAVNDTHGHEVGDKLLKAVAIRLAEVVSRDITLARLGGDEFGAVIFDGTDCDRVMQEADRIVDALRQPFVVDGKRFFIGASCGVARTCSGVEDPDTLIKAADIAMYQAKASGRCRAVLFEPRMLAAQEQRRILEADLRRAVQRGELEIVYQALADSNANTLEARLSWPHPVRGVIAPEVFMPLAEETGLVFSLGEWVLRKVCVEATTWPTDISVAVNLSPLQFCSPNLLSRVVGALAASGLSPARLELQIGETALLRAEEHCQDILRSLKTLGVRVSIGHFGSGYASMGHRDTFEVDEIANERRFVQGLEAPPGSALLPMICDLGNQIGTG